MSIEYISNAISDTQQLLQICNKNVFKSILHDNLLKNINNVNNFFKKLYFVAYLHSNCFTFEISNNKFINTITKYKTIYLLVKLITAYAKHVYFFCNMLQCLVLHVITSQLYFLLEIVGSYFIRKEKHRMLLIETYCLQCNLQ